MAKHKHPPTPTTIHALYTGALYRPAMSETGSRIYNHDKNFHRKGSSSSDMAATDSSVVSSSALLPHRSETTPLIPSLESTRPKSPTDAQWQLQRQTKLPTKQHSCHEEGKVSLDDWQQQQQQADAFGGDARVACRRRMLPAILTILLCLVLGMLEFGSMQTPPTTSAWALLSSPWSKPQWADHDGDGSPANTADDDSNAQQISRLAAYFGSSLTNLDQAAVASDHKVCSAVGNRVLHEQGGNAVDAAVATALCLGVASPASSGLGGGAFLLIRSSQEQFDENQRKQMGSSSSSSSKQNLPVFEDARTMAHAEDGYMTEVIDCREVASEQSSRDMYSGLPQSASMAGGLAIPVPGELRGLELAHSRHGRLPWKDVVEPAMLLARDGVPVDSHTAKYIKSFFEVYIPLLGGLRNPVIAGIIRYLSGSWGTDHNHHQYLTRGELLKNPPLAETLRRVANEGADALYKGPIAQGLVRDVQRAGGILTLRDMGSYKAVLRTPVSAQVSGYTLLGVPPPSSGGAVVIGIARFLSGYAQNTTSLFSSKNPGLSVHRMVEGMRHAFAIRMSLSDPAFHSNVTESAVRDLTANGYMESLRKMTLDDTVLPLSKYGGPKWAQLHDDDGTQEAEDAHEGDRRRRRRLSESNGSTMDAHRRRLARPFGYLEDNGTSHLSVVDSDGNAVAITTSINNIFGSLVFSETSGVLLGNTMDDFGVPMEGSNAYGIKPSEANFIVPGKRPLSSMSPTMVLRNDGPSSRNKWGKLVMVWGGSGGPKIISSVVAVFLNVLFRGMSLFDAVTSPRVHDQLLYHNSIVTTVEKATLNKDGSGSESGPTLEVPEMIKRALLERHHNLLDIDYTGCVQAILVDHKTNTLSAVSDLRKDGSPAGY